MPERKVETFDCEVCKASCIRWTGSQTVTERRCFEHASDAERERRRHDQLTLGVAA